MNGLRFINPYQGYRIADGEARAPAFKLAPRGPLERAADEMASWFGNHDAELRREADISEAAHKPPEDPKTE
ncbi:SWFGD domain-containing protein [Phenylobacterium aquaticum]|uniref:SWFGD domain-containing protein n=1 Tax=Phenylobacterium aquaticum TaxID=1763816 RepID=UPI0026EB8279|nr:SWFGD domain-containing protein [Phenylobacterium aquaticum]